MKTKKQDNICRLKYRLEPKENDVVEFQILEQDESLIIPEEFGKFGKWDIESFNHPAIVPKDNESDYQVIFLRGKHKSLDLHISKIKGHHLIPSIHTALEEMIKKVFGNCKRIEE